MIDQDKQQHLLKLRETLLKRCRSLEIKAASYGVNTPSEVLIEIEELEEKITSIDEALKNWQEITSVEVVREQALKLGQEDVEFSGTDTAKEKQAKTLDPPEFATYLLWYLPIDKKTREPLMGDLEEEFSIVYRRFGRRKAVIWYYYQVGASFWPFVVSGVKKLIKWGAVGLVGGAIRRLIP